MTANYCCCLPWDIHLQCTIMDSRTHINCRTQPAIVMWWLHTLGGENVSWNNPRPVVAMSGKLARGVLSSAELAQVLGAIPFPMLTWHPVLLPAPPQGDGSCRSDLSKPGQEEHYVKKRLPEVCGNSAWEIWAVAAILFERLFQACFFPRISQAFPELRGVTWPPPPPLLLHQVFSNVFC